MSRKLKITLITAVILVAVILVAGIAVVVGLFASSSSSEDMTDHRTIAEVKADKSGQELKVGGDVVPGSVSWDNDSRSLKFMLAGEGGEIPVVYEGVAPNDFKPGAPLLVAGTYSSSGIFLATSLETTTSLLCKACHG